MKQKTAIHVPLTLLGGTFREGVYEHSGDFYEDIMSSPRFPSLCRAIDTCDVVAPYRIDNHGTEAFITLQPFRTADELDQEIHEAIAEQAEDMERQEDEMETQWHDDMLVGVLTGTPLPTGTLEDDEQATRDPRDDVEENSVLDPRPWIMIVNGIPLRSDVSPWAWPDSDRFIANGTVVVKRRGHDILCELCRRRLKCLVKNPQHDIVVTDRWTIHKLSCLDPIHREFRAARVRRLLSTWKKQPLPELQIIRRLDIVNKNILAPF